MQLCQELATPSPFPASCISTHISSLRQEELIEAVSMISATELAWNNELSFDGDEIVLQDSCTNIEEQLLLPAATNNLCGDSYWHYYDFMQHEHDDAVADMEYSVDMWENWLQATSPSQNLDGAISPGYVAGESSSTFLANMDTSFVNLSRVHSNASAYASYQNDFCISNPVNEHFRNDSGTQSDATSYDCSSFLQVSALGNAPMTYSGSTESTIATSDDDFFDSAASSFAAIANPPPQAFNFTMVEASQLSLNLEARASQPQLNLKAGASHFQQNPEASLHTLNAAGSVRNTSNRRLRQNGLAVSFLVESSTAAIDDGHVWHKYGQKDIKGSMHPISYFKCAQPNCPIKKQTECSSANPGCVLFTYFGKHNH